MKRYSLPLEVLTPELSVEEQVELRAGALQL